MNKDSEKNPVVQNDAVYSQNERRRGFSIYNSEGNADYKEAVERVYYELKQELYPNEFAPRGSFPQKAEKGEEVKVNSLRKFPLILILILNIVALAAIVLSCFSIKGAEILAPFVKKTFSGEMVAVSILDGLFAKLSVDFLPAQLTYSIHADKTTEIMLLVFAICGAAVTVLTLIQVIIAIAGLATKGEGKGVRFGLVGLLTIIGMAGVLLSLIGLKAQVLGFGELCSLFLAEGVPCVGEKFSLHSGVGTYILLLVPIITMICSSCARKKTK